MNQDEVRLQLRLAVERAGGVNAFVAGQPHAGSLASAVRSVLAGKIKPTPQVLVPLGLRKRVVYEPIPFRRRYFTQAT